MEIEVVDLREGPEQITQKTISFSKVIKYLTETKDIDFIKDSPISKIEISAPEAFVKIHINNNVISIDAECIAWLKTHIYIKKAIFYKDQAEMIWDMIADKVDMFVIEDWLVKKIHISRQDADITYDRDFLYVKGINTNIPFSADNYEFVKGYKNRWL